MADIQIEVTDGTPEAGGWQRFEPSSHVSGRVTITPERELRAQHVWVRLQWHTEGRGDRDEGRVAETDLYQGPLAAGVPRTFSYHFGLPNAPWSFAGHYVGIVWEIAVQVALPMAIDLQASQPFIVAPR